jgi:hypothetical protein
MLQDHGREVERWAKRKQQRAAMPMAYGDFIAGLAPWDWWVTITFRSEAVPDLATTRIGEYLAHIQKSTGKPVGWVLAEEFGSWGGRFHCHLLITGVRRLPRRFWWHEAFRRFGRSEIRPFNPARAAAFYTAKYAAKALGQLHFGGTLAGTDLSLLALPKSAGGGRDSVLCPDLERAFYRLTRGKWHR